jgi:hypothetical protein
MNHLIDFREGVMELSADIPEFTEEVQTQVDTLEQKIMDMPPAECPVVHRFTPGLYIREILMPKGILLTSKIHMTEHPYVVSKGVVDVFIEGVGWKKYAAPFTGVTKPHTRRVLFIEEDTVWTTFHPNPTDETDLAKLEERLMLRRDDHLKNMPTLECGGAV